MNAFKYKKILCSQYRPEESAYGCIAIKLDNDDKHCVLVNNRCEEHYKNCRDIELDKRFTFIYNKCQEPETHCPFNETMREVCLHNVDRDGINCRIEYGSSHASYQIENGKTIYYSWSEDFCDGIGYISYCGHYTKYIDSKKCTSIIPSNSKKKCYFNYFNNSCVEEDKLCLDYKDNANNEICENAKTSAKNKICKLNNETDECIEIEIAIEEVEEEKTDSTKEIEDSTNNVKIETDIEIKKQGFEDDNEKKENDKKKGNLSTSESNYIKVLNFTLLLLSLI